MMLVPMRVRSMQKTAQHKPSAARVRQIHRPPSNLWFDEAAAILWPAAAIPVGWPVLHLVHRIGTQHR